MKKCELCKFPARAYCESDQASLCWDCDAKVHGANFLVARHSRTLLCHACQSQTPWNASGAKLGHTVSVCDSCTNGVNGRDHAEEEESEADNDDDGDGDDDEIYTDDDDEEEEEEEEEDGENQVVPWSCTTPPPPASSCSSEESETSLKRMRDNDSDLHYQDDLYCSCSQRKNRADGEATSVDSFRRLKKRRTEPDRPVQVEVEDQAGSKSAAIIKRFQHQRDKGKKLSQESEAVDVVVVNSSASPSR